MKRVVVISAIALLASCELFDPTFADVTLVNASGEAIRSATITVARHSYEVQNLAPGERHTISFVTAGDDSYQVSVRFESGRTLADDNMGYVAEGILSRDTIRVITDRLLFAADHRPESEPPRPLTPTAPPVHP